MGVAGRGAHEGTGVFRYGRGCSRTGDGDAVVGGGALRGDGGAHVFGESALQPRDDHLLNTRVAEGVTMGQLTSAG